MRSSVITLLSLALLPTMLWASGNTVGRGDLPVSFEASHSDTQMVYSIHIKGPLGNLSAEMLFPKGFGQENGRCGLVILLHGFLGSKKAAPLGFLARILVEQGYAVLRFDFDGYGKREGAQVTNTVPGMIQDARAVWDYASALPYVHRIVLLGHSQGGVVAGMLAGRLEKAGTPPAALIQLAPASILKEYARQGRFLSAHCDPVDPPDSINVYGLCRPENGLHDIVE